MGKSDEYRANAAECERMARQSRHAGEKATWLQMAQDWLRMIPKARQSASDRFDTAEMAQGTGQERSKAQH